MTADLQRRPTLHTLTALRFVAALAVFNFHVAPFFRGTSLQTAVGYVTIAGPAGVSFFFVLSGFVLTWSRRTDDRRRDFYRRRFARIYPTHIATWVAAGILLLALGFSLDPAGVALSAVLLQTWVPTPDVYYAMDAPSWSLSCELFFYALFPFCLPVLLRADEGRRRLWTGALLVGAAALPLLSTTADRLLPTDAAGWFPEFFPPARLLEFLLGALVALAVEDGSWRRIPLAPAAALAAAVFVVAGVAEVTRLLVTLLVLPFVLLIAAAAQAELRGTRGARMLAAPWLVRLGQWSFAFYLIHGLVFIGMVHLEGQHRLGTGGAIAWALATFAVSLALSGIAFNFFERPLERKLRPDHRVPTPYRTLPSDEPNMEPQPALTETPS